MFQWLLASIILLMVLAATLPLRFFDRMERTMWRYVYTVWFADRECVEVCSHDPLTLDEIREFEGMADAVGMCE